ncbi:MAG: DUF2953 domain-containing protein [Lachnospiraceae bacterium]|nr:DUF2953 domain-containing protein [Lachnospiraceae bacterium]
MLSVLLMILKVLGMIVLILLGTILLLILLVLFMPVRYQITLHRKVGEEIPVVVKVKATWLLHVLNAAFSYPEAAFWRVRIFCFTIFRSDKPKETAPKETDQKENVPKENVPKETSQKKAAQTIQNGGIKEGDGQKKAEKKVTVESQKEKTSDRKESVPEKQEDEPEEGGKKNKFFAFLKKLWYVFKNIKYTIIKICDKIKHIVKNIQYYLRILQSDTFHRAWKVCSGQVFSLLKSIFPRRIRGNLLIGTGDPAGTGQILAIYGIIYPLIGNHIDIVPDFERQIVEGDLLIKGKITAFKALKTAWIVYFNKDLRRLIKLFKREAA